MPGLEETLASNRRRGLINVVGIFFRSFTVLRVCEHDILQTSCGNFIPNLGIVGDKGELLRF